MKEINLGRVVIASLIFLLVISVTSALDWAAVSLIVSLGFLSKFPSRWFFIAGIIFLLLYLASFLSVFMLTFTKDLLISSYLLLLSGMVSHFWGGKIAVFQQKFPPDQLLKFGSILVGVFLVYPLFGETVSALIGYFCMVSLFRKTQDAYLAFGLAAFFLVLCPVFLILNQTETAGTSAVLVYLFLVIGIGQELVYFIRSRKLIKSL